MAEIGYHPHVYKSQGGSLSKCSVSSSLTLLRFPLLSILSSSIEKLASTSLVPTLFRLACIFWGVLPGSRRALENISLRLSWAILGVAFSGSEMS